MATETAPTYTGNTAGNVITSGALAAAGTTNANVDYSTVFEGQIHVKNTPGAAVSGTRGLQIDIYRRYGATPTTAQSSFMQFTLPSQTAVTAESVDFWVGPGFYNVKLTNLDAAQGLTVEVTGDTVDNVTTVTG